MCIRQPVFMQHYYHCFSHFSNVLLKLQKYSTHFSSKLVVNINHIDKICEVVYFKD